MPQSPVYSYLCSASAGRRCRFSEQRWKSLPRPTEKPARVWLLFARIVSLAARSLAIMLTFYGYQLPRQQLLVPTSTRYSVLGHHWYLLKHSEVTLLACTRTPLPRLRLLTVGCSVPAWCEHYAALALLQQSRQRQKATNASVDGGQRFAQFRCDSSWRPSSSTAQVPYQEEATASIHKYCGDLSFANEDDTISFAAGVSICNLLRPNTLQLADAV
ncbi:hypothetical protein J3E69DRAFT_159875 [Trichoderma sp. SZMC 28015]